MDDWTNDLAGKTNPFDRGIQKETGRRIMKGVEWLNGRVKSNAVLGNFASAAAQFFNIPNGVGYIKNPVDMAAGAKDWVKSVMPVHTDIDDLLEQSGFLGERYLDKGLNRLEKSDQLLKNILHSPQQFAECGG